MYTNIKLFKNIEENQIKPMLKCIGAFNKSYLKDEIIINQEEVINCIGVIISGSIDLVKVGYYGDKKIIATFNVKDTFAESIPYGNDKKSYYTIIAREKCEILFLPCDRILYSCNNACDFHNKLIFNLVKILATKNIYLNKKINYLSPKKTKVRLAKYLIDNLDKKELKVISPYNKSELAEFLGIDRSVLSREISKMIKENILEIKKNVFYIKDLKELDKLNLE